MTQAGPGYSPESHSLNFYTTIYLARSLSAYKYPRFIFVLAAAVHLAAVFSLSFLGCPCYMFSSFFL
jgi:hypothetical protein